MAQHVERALFFPELWNSDLILGLKLDITEIRTQISLRTQSIECVNVKNYLGALVRVTMNSNVQV